MVVWSAPGRGGTPARYSRSCRCSTPTGSRRSRSPQGDPLQHRSAGGIGRDREGEGGREGEGEGEGEREGKEEGRGRKGRRGGREKRKGGRREGGGRKGERVRRKGKKRRRLVFQFKFHHDIA